MRVTSCGGWAQCRRRTLHFVPAEDLRWMLALLAPRVLARTAARFERSAVLHPDYAQRADAGNGIFNPAIAIDG